MRAEQMKLTAVTAVMILCALLMSACETAREAFRQTSNSESLPKTPSPLPTHPESVHLAFGNPSNATTDSANRDNFLVIGEGSVFSFNNSKGTINWVSWKTSSEDLGNALPRPEFRPDLRLPEGFRRIGYYDYSGSGYDRGHIVPSADRFANPRLNEETFMMTNIVPQSKALNRYPWQKLESYVRTQARRGNDIYQIAGVYGRQKVLKNKVVVPTNCWKIVAILPRGRTVPDMDRRMRLIAVDMPNEEGIENAAWEKYKVTVRSIEEKTGLNFFSHLPPDVQDRLETVVEIRSP